MKYLLVTIFAFISVTASFAQQQNAKQLQETAKLMMQQGDFANAVTALEKAAQLEPNNFELLKDLSFANYLKRDFAKAIEVGKPLIQRAEADEQVFQILGMSYKSIAQYKECAKLYKDALKKFPNSGVIYNEYGELLEMDDNNVGDAIVKWEKGISIDPGFSGNYYNAARYYTKKGEWIRVLLYAEIFLNLESYSARVEDAKKGLLTAYQNLFKAGNIQEATAAKGVTAFEKALLETYAKATGLAKDGINIDNLTTIRTRFVLEWFQGKQQQYPFQLFDRQQYLLREGLFEAYNQWLFGGIINADAYQLWQNTHPKEEAGFKTFQQSRVFKIPAGQYYMTR